VALYRLVLASLTAGLLLTACGLSLGGLETDSPLGSPDAEDATEPVPGADGGMWGAPEGAISDRSVDRTAADGGGAPLPGDDAGGTGADAGGHAADCDANLADDPAHCGRCDRDCAGGACQSGSCAPAAIVSSDAPIRALGISTSYLVWATVDRQIFRADLDGGGATPILSTTEDVDELVVAGSSIYYTTGDLHRVAIDGTGDQVVASGRADACLQVAGALVYVVSGSTAPLSIDVVNLDAGSRTTLVPSSDVMQPWGVAVTSTDVYWSGNQHGSPDGGIWRMNLSGGAPAEVVPHLANPNCLTVYGGALYWPNADDGTIMTSALDGTGESVLAKGQDLAAPPTTVAVDERFVYWQSAANVMRLAR
jgi:hypothetical protein